LQTPNTLLGHVVGTGKTYTMVAAAMELKSAGTGAQADVRRAQPHTRSVFDRVALLYPGVNILVAGKEDFES
jgi:N12 class adenine-specific DNA methylase